MPQPDPNSAKDEGDEGGRDSEEVDEGVELEHEHQLVVGSDEPHEEVHHEQNVQQNVKLNVKKYTMNRMFIRKSY